ncbi:hypothetical protein HPB49_002693 [Dermacentor silvarum]|uniref:Uncharacterized protein n=1 Tax=Dermacentor silvarum TaxID=543639 RepID=A0ACB8CP10_DERSI|nr:hypothetical protein HPB49_002693 [Dermacentor silvarum]
MKTSASSRTRFSQDTDLALLREVRAVKPFADQAGWASVATNVKTATQKDFSQRALRDRLDLLLAQYRRNDRANMRKSGTEEQYTEKDQLLQEISQLADDFGHKIRLTPTRKVACACPQSSSILAAERSAASVARDGAAAMYVVQLTDVTVVEEADLTWNPDTETAASAQFMHMYEDVQTGDEAAFDIDVPTRNNSPGHVTAQPDPEPCSARGTLRGAKRAAEGGNLVFFEKRLQYEKSIRVAECTIEERKIVLADQRLGLDRDQLEQRRREWEGQQRMLDEDKQLQIAELHRLQKQHELEVQEHRAEREASLATQRALLEVLVHFSRMKNKHP